MVIEAKHKRTTKLLAPGHVTTLSYDMDTKRDDNINQEIKEDLMGMGWCFSIPEIRVKDIMRGYQQKNNVDTPATTAWKELLQRKHVQTFVQLLLHMTPNTETTIRKGLLEGRPLLSEIMNMMRWRLFKAVENQLGARYLRVQNG